MTDHLPTALPFDPNPRPPSWRLPEGACDTHFHVFGPPHKFPYSAQRRYEPSAAPIEYYWDMQKITGLTRGIIVQPTAHGLDNSAIVDAIARSDGRLKGVACFNEETTDAQLDALKAAGIVGARFSLMSDRPGTRTNIEHALPRLAKRGWSLHLHIEANELLACESFLRELPGPVIIDHIARINPKDGLQQPAFQLLLDLLSDDRFWTKLCCLDKLSACPAPSTPDAIPYLDTIPFAKAAIEKAPDRVIWGTDWPHGNTFTLGRIPNEGALLDLFAAISPDRETRNRILVDNPARLYRF